jgi:hypothetical protein
MSRVEPYLGNDRKQTGSRGNNRDIIGNSIFYDGLCRGDIRGTKLRASSFGRKPLFRENLSTEAEQ